MPDVTTDSFPPGTTVTIAPPAIVQSIISTIVCGAPFARSLTCYPTTSGTERIGTPEGRSSRDDRPAVWSS
jgi:hypothetical protein